MARSIRRTGGASCRGLKTRRSGYGTLRRGHEGPVYGALYSPDGRRILSWSHDQTLRLWDAATGAAIGEPLRHEGPVYGALYSPDGRRILSWSHDQTLRLWDAATGAAIGEPMRHEGLVWGALYSPDGRRILSWSDDKTLRLWDAAWRGDRSPAATRR